MRVGIQRQHLPANKSSESERPARRCVIGINQRLGPECSLDTAAFPDDVFRIFEISEWLMDCLSGLDKSYHSHLLFGLFLFVPLKV